MNVKRVLEEIPVDEGAEERAWSVVRTAYARREPALARVRRWPLAAAGLAAVVAAAAFSPPGRAVVDAVRRSIGVEHAAPALFRLPAPGRLLVSGDGGTWVVSADGSKRRLGDYTDASWSPHGLFVVAAAGDELAAIEPGSGRVHWTLSRPGVSLPRWGGSRADTRIAYLSGHTLRVVAGDGTGDHALRSVTHVAPAWKPGTHILAYATARAVWVVDTDSGHLVAAHPTRGATALAWSPDGTELAVATPARVYLYAKFNQFARVRGVHALAFAKGGPLAMLRARTIFEIAPERVGTIATLPGAISGLAWSPDGRWLVTSLPAANQWVFVGAHGLRAVGRITQQFGGAVSLDGWVAGA